MCCDSCDDFMILVEKRKEKKKRIEKEKENRGQTAR
jgi:hypothetical protein